MGKCTEASINWIGTVTDEETAAATAECEAAANAAADAFGEKTDAMVCLKNSFGKYNQAVASWNNADVGGEFEVFNIPVTPLKTAIGMNVAFSSKNLGLIKSGGDLSAVSQAQAVIAHLGQQVRSEDSTSASGQDRSTGSSWDEVMRRQYTHYGADITDDKGEISFGKLAAAAFSAEKAAGTGGVAKYRDISRLVAASYKEKQQMTDADYQKLSNLAKDLVTHMNAISKCHKSLQDAMDDFQEANMNRQSQNTTETNWAQIFSEYYNIADPDKWTDQARRKAAAASNARSGNMAVAHSNYKDRLQFKAQCLLLAKILELSDIKKTQIEVAKPKKLPRRDGTQNACLMVDGDPYGFINRLTQSRSHRPFFNMTSDQISTLQPMIRLYKIKTDSKGKPYQQELKFDSYAKNVKSVFEEKSKRGFGVGVKKFDFTYDGSNPFAVKKSIKAQLTIFANSFDELLIERSADVGPDYRYADLALKTGKLSFGAKSKLSKKARATAKLYDNMDKLDFRLKAVVGWALPRGGGTTATSKNLKTAVYDSFVTLNLTPTTHEFNIDDMGRVTFVINYLAYIEDFFDQPQFNIFSHTETSWKQLSRRLKWASLKENDNDCGATTIKEDKKKLAEDGSIIREKRASLMQIIQDLLNGGHIQNIQMTETEIANFKEKGPFFESKNAKKTRFEVDKDGRIKSSLQKALNAKKREAVSGGEEEKKAYDLAISQVTTDSTKQYISFFYLSSLVDVVLMGIEENLKFIQAELGANAKMFKSADLVAQEKENYRKFEEQFKRYRVLLGPLEVQNVALAPYGSRFVNLGDIPISVEYFLQWMTDKLLKKEDTVYHLPKFLNDLINHFVRNFLNEDSCFSMNLKQKVRVNQAAITSYQLNKRGGDEITNMIRAQGGRKGKLSRAIIGKWGSSRGFSSPLLNISGVRGTPIGDYGVGKETNYMIFFAGRTQPTEQMMGKRDVDEAAGIFHYSIGRDSGIVKKINLQKTDSKFLKEVRFESEGFDGLEQLREVYDVEIETFANPHAFPGTYIFVEPRGFAPNTTRAKGGGAFDLTRYGVGGYHMIISSTHTFAPGVASSTIRAKWVAQIDAGNKSRHGAEQASSPNESIQKCAVNNSNRQAEADGGKSNWWKSLTSALGGYINPANDVNVNPDR